MKELNLNTKVLVGSIFFGLQQFQEKFGKLVNYVGVVDPPTPVESKKLKPGAAKVLDEFREVFLKNYKIAPGDPGFTSFGGTYVLLKYLLPQAKSMDPEAIRKAALDLDLEDLTTPYAFGVKFAPPGHAHAGTNLKAYPAILQWQNEAMHIVYPKKLAAKDVMLPMPTWPERK
jgi:branched-chain amino acid transport system substrate-binding protein